MQPTPLATKRLRLSAPTASVVEVMTEYCQDPELARYVPLPVPYTLDSARLFIHELVPAGWMNDTEYNWAPD